jgi:hypothetical protein
MVTISTHPASIECDGAFFKTRKLTLKIPMTNTYPTLRVSILYRFVMERNSEASITKELKPKVAIFDNNSMLNQGDGIRGECISGKSIRPIRKDDLTVEKGSGSHRAGFLNVNGFVYAKLERFYAAIRNRNLH